MPDDGEEDAIAAAVEAGTDGIEVPTAFLEETDEKQVTPEIRSLYAQISNMSMAEKIKLALRGNKEARNLLVRDGNKIVRRFVLKNPRMTDTEVVAVTRNRSADDEMLRMISEKREWNRNYQIRLGLVTNPKTPMVVSMRVLGTLGERDLRAIAKSRNVPQAVAVQARRLLTATKKEP